MILEAIAEALITPADVTPPVPHRVVAPSRSAIRSMITAATVLPASWIPFARCVSARESHNNPRAVNESSGAAGIFQWMPDWRHGLPYVVQRGLVAYGLTPAAARTIRLTLPDRIERWPATMQRIGFARIIAEGGRSAALRHWSGGNGCNALVAR